MRPLADILDEYEFLDADERYRLLIELGRELDEMPPALKTDATLVRGCSASVWVYPTEQDGQLHFLADSNAAITKASSRWSLPRCRTGRPPKSPAWTSPPRSRRST
jgi:cysteine desulfuration protein SufE